jgi:hypothetical protein
MHGVLTLIFLRLFGVESPHIKNACESILFISAYSMIPAKKYQLVMSI